MSNQPASPVTRESISHMILGQLYTNDIADKRILQAMHDIAREPFVPENLRGSAYVDEDLEVARGRYLMEPLTFAKLLDLAQITPSCRILVIGCLSGYAAAIVAQLGGAVVAVDSDAGMIEQAREHMRRLKIGNINVQTVSAMQDGYALSAPYDVIVIQGAVEVIGEALGSQLAIGGRLVTVKNVATRPGIKGGLGKGLLVQRIDHKLQYREHFDAGIAVLAGFERPEGFRF
jgi:protein-L-isoaspartate(D-aspartate) O-methyltransferase